MPKQRKTQVLPQHRLWRVALPAACLATLAAFAILRKQPVASVSPQEPKYLPSSFSALLALNSNQLASVEIARINLLCQPGLSPSGSADFSSLLDTLHAMAKRVRSETERHLYRFRRNPAEFDHSEAFFRMVMMGVVLAEDFQVRYDAQRRAAPADTAPNDGFFAAPNSVFLGGLLGPSRQGTCSSLPVLYVALGRELGYPLKLVTTKGHLFVRWEAKGERFNIETTSHGINRFDDDYYRHWPFELTPAEEAAEAHLRSLTPPEELAVFLSIRGMCFREMGRSPEAADAFAAASRLAPNVASYRYMANALQSHGLSIQSARN